ncbi:MAG TPA: SdrD B-like domain-containing protein [Tepidisphaeraceae bacterium]|nr:SdrD B-like domain-containing protein [Tepidisphaeraceae bacterium]
MRLKSASTAVIERLESRRLLTTVAVVNQGVAHDSFGDTAVGWTGFLLTVNADAGQTITAMDLGTSADSTRGIFGEMLQDWLPGKGGTLTPTPAANSSDAVNGSNFALDSHLLVMNRVNASSPSEDSDGVHPVGLPPNDASDAWGTGSYLHGAFGITSGSAGGSVALAYIVLPTGASGSYSFDVAQSDGVHHVSGMIAAGASISGTMFSDINGDGVRQSSEPPLVGWGCFIDQNANGAFDPGDVRVYADAAGHYQFDNLAPGTYAISQITPTSWRRTFPAKQIGFPVYTITLGSASVAGKNIGNQQLATISGLMFNDLNGDGIHQSTEPVMPGWGCFLDFNNNGAFDTGTDQRVYADATGTYTFSNLVPGTYHVHQVTPTGWRRTTPTSSTYTLTLKAGGVATARNFAMTQKVLITGNVFNDANGSKTRDSGEAGLSGWRVFIDSNNDGVWGKTEISAVTDSAGNFSFKTLDAGTFIVRVVRPSGWSQTTTQPASFTLTSGQTISGIAFGERQTA